MAKQSERDKAAAQRRKVAEQMARAQARAAQDQLGDVFARYEAEQRRLRGMLGGMGMLSSGVGGNVLGKHQLEAAKLGGRLSNELQLELLRAQQQAQQWEGGHELDWAKYGLSEREQEGRLGLDRERLGLERELGTGDLSLREQQLAQQAAQAEAQRQHEASLQEGRQTWQSGESAASREHELGLETGRRAWQSGENVAGREHELALQTRSQQWQSGESALGRQHEQELAQQAQQFEAGQAGLNRGHEQAMQTAQHAWASEESAAGREHEATLQQGSQAHQQALAEAEQAWRTGEADLDRQAAAVRQEKELALESARLAQQAAQAEADRGVQRDEQKLRERLEEARLAQQKAEFLARQEIELARLADEQRRGQLAGQQSALGLLGQGLDPNHPLAQEYLAAAGFDPATMSPEVPAVPPPVRTPGMSDHQWQLAQMSHYWDQQRAQQQAERPVFNQPVRYGGYGYGWPDTPLDYYNAETARLNALRGAAGNASIPAAGSSVDLSGIPREDRRSVAHVMTWLETGQVPNINSAALSRGAEVAYRAGLVTGDDWTYLQYLLKDMGGGTQAPFSTRAAAARKKRADQLAAVGK